MDLRPIGCLVASVLCWTPAFMAVIFLFGPITITTTTTTEEPWCSTAAVTTEDPCKVLGIPLDATNREVVAAFVEKTKDMEGCEEKWRYLKAYRTLYDDFHSMASRENLWALRADICKEPEPVESGWEDLILSCC